MCVIGGGPAGMMAAGRAAELGARVVLLEKNDRLGIKLLITGGGRCNVTNAEPRLGALIERYGERGKFLHGLFARFGPNELIALLKRFGLGVVIEAEQRVFPRTERSDSVLEVLDAYLKRGAVEVRTRSPVRALAAERGARRIAEAVTDRGAVRAKSFVLATGGLSRPETGSTGDGFRWLTALGHTVRIPEPSLVPVRVREAWVRELQGLAFEDARLTASPLEAAPGAPAPPAPPAAPGAPAPPALRPISERGKLLFTHFGLSGPLALNLSSRILALSRECGGADDQVRLAIDLLPTTDHGALDAAVRASIAAAPNRKVRNSLPQALPARLVPVLLRIAGVDPDLPAHSLTRGARLEIVRLMKALPLTFDGLLGTDKAIVTSGGIDLSEVDFRTMRSRLYDNLYVTGDLLDFERRSGGYSLQLCWSSGWVAGEAAASDALLPERRSGVSRGPRNSSPPNAPATKP